MNLRNWSREHVRGLLVAIAITALGAGVLLAPPAGGAQSQKAATTATGQAAFGMTGSCAVDASGYCTVNHGLGVKPTAVTVTPALIGQLASVDPASTTATSFRVRFYWYEPGLFAAGTVIRYNAVLTVPDSAPPATTPPPASSPPVSTPPASSPPVSTPPATTPPPTTPTAGASPAQTCTSPNFTTTSTDNNGDGVTYGEYFVHNNMWNNSNGTYTLKACSADKWWEEATQPAPADHGVQTYPNVHKDYADVALFNSDGSPKIRSAKFAAATPATCTGCVYDVAFDAWLGSGLNNELMIWTENKGQTPAGSKVAAVTFAGHTYDVWHETGYTAYVSRDVQKFGTMPLGEILKDMNTRGWIPTKTTWQVDYGVEIVSTANVKQRFDFTDFSIDDDY